MLNSLSQSLTALPAPSGREPLAKPEALQLSRELSRYAKGPIPEGAVAVGDWGSSLPANAAAFLHFMALSVKFLKIRAGGFANPGGFMLYLS